MTADGAELAARLMDAQVALEVEAAAIFAARPDDFGIQGRIAGPAVAVRLVLDAMFQRPDVVPAIAAYFSCLAETRGGSTDPNGSVGPEVDA